MILQLLLSYMKKYELWSHTLTAGMATYVVLPMSSYQIMEADYVQGIVRPGRYLEIDDLQVRNNALARNRRQGRGTVLLDAIAKFAKKNNRSELTGHFVTEERLSEYVERWYNNHGIQIENGYLVGGVDTVLAMCAQIMSNYQLLYEVVKEPRYDL